MSFEHPAFQCCLWGGWPGIRKPGVGRQDWCRGHAFAVFGQVDEGLFGGEFLAAAIGGVGAAGGVFFRVSTSGLRVAMAPMELMKM